MITIDVRRDEEDGGPQVTRIVGTAGMAVTIKGTDLEAISVDPTDAAAVMRAQKHMPTVSLRANTLAEVALMLAGLISAVHHAEPAAVPIALKLAAFMDSGHPDLKIEYPRFDYER